MSPLETLKKYWGYESFRPLQEDIIQSVLDGKDTLALMPTGGGKSICFQVPALAQEGICIVISPLIALMKDQVDQLVKRNIPAVAIYSGMHYRDIDRIFDNCAYGNTKFLYLSPERLTTDLAIERIKKMNVNLLAVDEAHCISQWGYDFRPPYLRIAEIREWLPDVPILALTATATPAVVTDIQDKLEFKKKNILQKSFERQNVAYVVLKEENKHKKLLDIVRNVRGTGIVYAANRRATKQVAAFLQKNNISADFYHAGLSSEVRSIKQDKWIKGQIRVMACTNAFGMGIDKPDVRSVVHMDLPNNLEAYFQEAGRGGRDGKKSFAVLLYHAADKARLEYDFQRSFPEVKEIRRVYRALGSYFQLAVGAGKGRSFNFDLLAFSKRFKFQAARVFSALKILEQAGILMMSEAIFIPSSLRFLVNKEKLYDYQLRNPRLDIIIKTILRSSHGAFNHYVNIREHQLAQFLKRPFDFVSNGLLKLQQDNIIDYRPQKDSPQIIFLEERLDADNLAVDQQLYNFRKNRQLERIKKAIAYAETEVCRSRQLLAYFGEVHSPDCGICDVCLNKKNRGLSKEDYERYKKKIEVLLKRERLTSQEVIDSFPAKRQEQVLASLAYLAEEGFVKQVEGKLVWA